MVGWFLRTSPGTSRLPDRSVDARDLTRTASNAAPRQEKQRATEKRGRPQSMWLCPFLDIRFLSKPQGGTATLVSTYKSLQVCSLYSTPSSPTGNNGTQKTLDCQYSRYNKTAASEGPTPSPRRRMGPQSASRRHSTGRPAPGRSWSNSSLPQPRSGSGGNAVASRSEPFR